MIAALLQKSFHLEIYDFCWKRKLKHLLSLFHTIQNLSSQRTCASEKSLFGHLCFQGSCLERLWLCRHKNHKLSQVMSSCFEMIKIIDYFSCWFSLLLFIKLKAYLCIKILRKYGVLDVLVNNINDKVMCILMQYPGASCLLLPATNTEFYPILC